MIMSNKTRLVSRKQASVFGQLDWKVSSDSRGEGQMMAVFWQQLRVLASVED